MSTQATLVALFCLATLIAIGVRRIRIPYTIALVIAGIGLGQLSLIAPPQLTQELLFTFFLPGLLFEAAFHMDLEALKQTWKSVLLLAIPGVMLSIAATAALVLGMFALIGGGDSTFGWPSALVFGALVAATDPVAVTALFREIKVPARLTTLVEAESLFNDGTAVVFLGLVVGFASGAESAPAAVATSFVLIAGGGALVGFVVGYAVTRLIRGVDEPMIEIALTTIAALGSFVLAEALHLSPVLATVLAGLVCARHSRAADMSRISREAADYFWQYVGFALNSIVFLLIGLELRPGALVFEWRAIMIGFVAMTIARVLLVSLVAVAQKGREQEIPRPWSAILVWGGLRGALSMVLALGLPRTLPHRELIVAMTVGAVVASLLLQGLTMPALVSKLRA